MKVLLVNLLYPPDGIGGSERSVQYLAKGLLRLGHEVHVASRAAAETTRTSLEEGVKVTRVGSPPGYQPNVLAKSPEEVEALKKSFKGKVIPFSTSVVEMIAKQKPAVVHCNVVGGVSTIWNYCKKEKVPVVQTLRSYSMMCSSRMLVGGRPCTSWCDCCQKKFGQQQKDSAGIGAVVGISEHILNTFVQQGFFSGARYSEVIANSYEAESVANLPAIVSKGTKITLGCLGRIHESKGIETVLKAFSALNDKKMVLRIGGSGNPDYIAYLQNKYGSDRIEFCGFVNPQEFINTVDALCVPSLWHEPFGRVNMESLAHGRPVIGSKRGGIPEIVEDGVNGWLYEPYSDQQFMNVLQRISKLSMADWEASHQRCLVSAQRYGVETIAEQYETLYNRLAAAF